ncbi:MAG: DNA double-strand break repair nuclease NurA [Candidatus Thorarchaeota archaeon]
MIELQSENPFNELPEALVVDMLSQCDSIGLKLTKSFQNLYEIRKDIRNQLKEKDLLKKDSDIMLTPTYPTSCAVDGSFSIDKLLSTDIVAAAGVAVEGLAPPTEVRHWPRPRHDSQIFTINHSNSTNYITSAIMMCMELSLAVKAPHNVVFFDGSFVTPLVYMNQAFNTYERAPEELKEDFSKRLKLALAAYMKAILSKKTDQIYVAVPKYTTRQEITHNILHMNSDYEDRSLLSFILKPGEVVGPTKVQMITGDWRVENAPSDSTSLVKKVIQYLENLCILYYRPYDHLPALRLELSPDVINNPNRFSVLLESVKSQCSVPGLLEPFPLYLADRMAKHLRTALPAVRKTATQEMSLKWSGSYSDLYFAMHGYRTEWGK